MEGADRPGGPTYSRYPIKYKPFKRKLPGILGNICPINLHGIANSHRVMSQTLNEFSDSLFYRIFVISNSNLELNLARNTAVILQIIESVFFKKEVSITKHSGITTILVQVRRTKVIRS